MDESVREYLAKILALLGLLDAWWVACAFMALLGVTFGLNGAIETALRRGCGCVASLVRGTL